MKTLYKPEDEEEAIAVKALLEANSIYPSMQSFHDTAYDGIYQGQHGWGVIKVDEADYEIAIASKAAKSIGTRASITSAPAGTTPAPAAGSPKTPLGLVVG